MDLRLLPWWPLRYAATLVWAGRYRLSGPVLNGLLALDQLGNVWAWGSNSSGQLGLPLTTASVSTPTVVPFPGPVAYLSFGSTDGVALLDDDTYCRWGANRRPASTPTCDNSVFPIT